MIVHQVNQDASQIWGACTVESCAMNQIDSVVAVLCERLEEEWLDLLPGDDDEESS